MPITTRNPTANETPDSGQGGIAVSGNTNTGHGSTALSASGGDTSFATCLWTSFPSVGGQILSAKLKADWSQSGSLTGGGFRSNGFAVEYSLNNGSTWNFLFNHTDITSSSSGSDEVSLSTSQDLTQVRLRDSLTVAANVGNSAQVTASISNIRIEVITQDQTHLLVMM